MAGGEVWNLLVYFHPKGGPASVQWLLFIPIYQRGESGSRSGPGSSLHQLSYGAAQGHGSLRKSGEWKQFGGYHKRQEWMEMTTTTRVSEIKHEQFHMISILIEISHIVNNVKKCRIISFLPFSLMNVKCACNLNTIQETKQSLKITLHKTQGKISY